MRILLALTAAAMVLPVSAGAASGATVEVYVFNFGYSTEMPGTGIIAEPTIVVGDTVRWVWLAGLHSVTSLSGSLETFDSGLITPPSTFEHTFSAAGDFGYYCLTHGADNGDGTFSGMGGYVHVQPFPAPSGAALGAIGLLAGLRRRR